MDKGNKRSGSSLVSGKAKKQDRMHQARSISTQASPSSSSRDPAVASSSHALGSNAGPLKAARTLDVVGFVEARSFEVTAMHSAMERSKDASAERAFQSLPRHLRRRAASHNIKRLPVRLRERARREVELDPVKEGKKPSSRYKKRRSGTISQEYLRRQGSKRWLETHIWHAKRMKMIDIWGYKLAEHSNEHNIKSAYKSSHHQCILQDSSYNGCLELTGSKKDIAKAFSHLLDPTLPTITSARYAAGNRQFTARLYEYDTFPQRMVAPATFLWRQDGTTEDAMDMDSTSNSQLWVWIHPSAFEQGKAVIEDAVAQSQPEQSVQVKDLENSLVMFDFTGPRSTALLQAVLKPTPLGSADINEHAHRTWRTLADLRTSSSLPPGVVLALVVDDPRLTFPHQAEPRNALVPKDQSKAVQDLITHWPANVAHSRIWDAAERQRLLDAMIPEAELNKRRAQNLIPGTKLVATEADAKIPILLMQREGQPQIQRAPGGGSSEFECGWTIIVPKGWGMAFWKSFIFVGARPGGLRERRSFHFETRQSCFPYDFPNTAAYKAYADEYKTEAEAKYGRIPVAKKINYAKMGVQDPFGAAWIKVLKAGMQMLGGSLEEDLNTLQENGVWLLQTPKVIATLKETAEAAGKETSGDASSRLTIESLNTAMTNCLQSVWTMTRTPSLPSARIEEALIRVGVDLLGRGTIGMNSMIYAIPEKHYKEWAARVALKGKRTVEGQPRKQKKTKSWVDSDTDEDRMDEEDEGDFDELELAIPPPDSLLGYVITGQYCYSEGKSYGIGCCSATGLAKLIEQETRQRTTSSSSSPPPSTTTTTTATVMMTMTRQGAGSPKVPRMMVLVRSVRSRVSRLAKLAILS
ncbi:MAG: ribonucleases P/MRP protein subunit POP1-domain-containing protein [Benniella sp.]|nr:MAG: ribonucleases P/MRP protein subunit POP1-domain-containing protein [Benniella sp.]